MALKELTATADRKVKVVPGDDPPAPEVLAQAIVDISNGVKKLYNTRLTEKTLVLLISHASKVTQKDVQAVLSAMYYLDKTYLKPSSK
jgi:hypothetical protein